jgi:patatin-like phospholipase/acyl hydrolase
MGLNMATDQAALRPFQILSLDGGGIKGLFSAALLAKLEQDLSVRIVDHFDLIAGTSTGGIIAVGLGLGLGPKDIVNFYTTHGPKIFSQIRWWSESKHYFTKKYPQAPLKRALRECFGERLLGESKKRLVIPSYNLDRDDVYVFKTPHHERLRRDHSVEAWKVALATSAAPTFFECCREVDGIRLIDGGVWANNPIGVAIAEAVSMLGVQPSQLSVLSLGTSDPLTIRKKKLNSGGYLSWASTAPDLIMRGQTIGAHTQALHLLGKDRVERVNPKVRDDLFGLDKVTSEDLLSAASSVSREFSPIFETRFKPHVSPEYVPAVAPTKPAVEGP